MVSRPRFDDDPRGPAGTPDDGSGGGTDGLPPPVADPEHPRASRPGLSSRAEIQFLAIAVAGALLLLLSGLPGGREPLAGDGSAALKQGWAERLREHAERPAEPSGARVGDPLPPAPKHPIDAQPGPDDAR